MIERLSLAQNGMAFQSLRGWSESRDVGILRSAFVVTDMKHDDRALETEEELCRLADDYGCSVFFLRKDTAAHVMQISDEARRSRLSWLSSSDANSNEIYQSAVDFAAEFHSDILAAVRPESEELSPPQTFAAVPSLLAGYIVRFVRTKLAVDSIWVSDRQKHFVVVMESPPDAFLLKGILELHGYSADLIASHGHWERRLSAIAPLLLEGKLPEALLRNGKGNVPQEQVTPVDLPSETASQTLLVIPGGQDIYVSSALELMKSNERLVVACIGASQLSAAAVELGLRNPVCEIARGAISCCLQDRTLEGLRRAYSHLLKGAGSERVVIGGTDFPKRLLFSVLIGPHLKYLREALAFQQMWWLAFARHRPSDILVAPSLDVQSTGCIAAAERAGIPHALLPSSLFLVSVTVDLGT